MLFFNKIVLHKVLNLLTTYFKQFKSSYSKQKQFEFELDYLILNLSRIVYVFTLFAKKCLAIRLQSVPPSIINEDQTVYLQSRYIKA